MERLIRGAEAAGIAVLAVFVPIQAMLLTVLVLVLADLFFGVWVAKRRGEAITSRGIRRSITKILVYELALLLVFLAEQNLGLPLPATKIVGSLIAVAELKSLIESFDTLLGTNLFRSLIERLAPAKKKDQ